MLKGIAGVATESDVRHINDLLKQLADQDVTLAHLIEDSVSIINATRINLSETITTVNGLLTLAGTIKEQLNNLITEVLYQLDMLEHFSAH